MKDFLKLFAVCILFVALLSSGCTSNSGSNQYSSQSDTVVPTTTYTSTYTVTATPTPETASTLTPEEVLEIYYSGYENLDEDKLWSLISENVKSERNKNKKNKTIKTKNDNRILKPVTKSPISK